MNKKKIVAVFAATAIATTLSLGVSAQTEEQSYVYFIAEKSVLGQGLTVEPVKVPVNEGDKGIDIVKKAAEIEYSDTGYGPYITAFKDTDTGAEVPKVIKDACTSWGTRAKDGYLSAYDYTSESGWSYFINDEYASVGIGDYVPVNGDVIRFSFTVYGYGADLGVDNSSGGGAAALVTPESKAELTRLAADCENKESEEYKNAVAVLGNLTATKDDVAKAVDGLKAPAETTAETEATVPETEAPETEASATDVIGDSENPGESNATDNTGTGVTLPLAGVGISAVALIGAYILKRNK